MGTGKATIRTRSGETRKQGDTSSWHKSGSSSTSSPSSPSSGGPKKHISLKEAAGGRSDIPARDALGREVKSTTVSLKTARSRTKQSVKELPGLADQQAAAKIVGVKPELAVHLTKYDVLNILGSRSMTIKSEKARQMYTNILKAREAKGETPGVTGTQKAAIKRTEAREAALQKRLRETPLLDIKGKEIPRFGAVIKNGEVVGTQIIGKRGAKGIISGGVYFSRKAYSRAQEINKYANKNITKRTNALDIRRIKSARKTILESLKGRNSVEAVRYFNRLDVAAPVSAFVPTKQATARVTEKLIQAGILALADTKYTEAQKRQIVKTKLMRAPVKQDLKADWASLDTKLSKGLNLPTESEIAAHRDRTFGKIPGFTKWQADFAKKMDTPRYFHGLNLSVEKGFKDFSINEYNRLRTKPATYGAELAAMFIGGEILGAVTKGGTIITKAGLAKAATKSTRPMVKAGLLKATKHLDKMVAAGYITPLVAQGITASWEDKFKLGKGGLVGGAGFARGAKIYERAPKIKLPKSVTEKVFERPGVMKKPKHVREITLEETITGELVAKEYATRAEIEAATKRGKAYRERAKKPLKPDEVTEVTLEETPAGELVVKEYAPKKKIVAAKRRAPKKPAKIREITLEETITGELVAKEYATRAEIEAATKRGKAYRERAKSKQKKKPVKTIEPTKPSEDGRLLLIEKPAEIKRNAEIAKSEIKTKQELKLKSAQIESTKVKSKVSEYLKVVPLSTIAERTKSLEVVDHAVKTNSVPAVVTSTLIKLKEVPDQITDSLIKESISTKSEIVDAIEETVKESEKIVPPRERPPKEKVKEPPVIPPLPAYKLKKKKEKERKEVEIIANEMHRTITNQLGDIKSILG